jgi:hypothetical protein
MAMHLEPGDFKTVALAYELFNACQTSIEAVRATKKPASADNLELWGGNLRRFAAALKTLDNHSWSPAQLENLKRDR